MSKIFGDEEINVYYHKGCKGYDIYSNDGDGYESLVACFTQAQMKRLVEAIQKTFPKD